MLKQAMDIAIDSGCSRASDPDMILSCSSELFATTAPVVAYASQISMTPAAACPLGTTMVPGGWPDPDHLHGSW